MKLPAEVKARRATCGLKEPTVGRQPVAGCPEGVKRSGSNTTHHHFAWHSCNHKACPQCGRAATAEWVAREQRKLIAAPCFMVTFTLPGMAIEGQTLCALTLCALLKIRKISVLDRAHGIRW